MDVFKIEMQRELCNAGHAAEVLCAEVVFNPMQLYINVNEVDDLPVSDIIHFLYTIRYRLHCFVTGWTARTESLSRTVLQKINHFVDEKR